MVSETNAHQFKYQDRWFEPVEFIYRGNVRREIDANLSEAENVDEMSRRFLKEQVQGLLQDMLKLERQQQNLDGSNKQPKSINFFSKFYEWLKGTERNLRLIQTRDRALNHDSEARTMRDKILYISKLQAVYEKKAAHFLDLAQDARNHQLYTTYGWTW